jgi:hypothetical protein
MADTLSQEDLDALWGQASGDEGQGQNGAAGETPASPGLSQADLDALFGAAGIDITPTADSAKAAATPPAPVSDSLSQDDIDRLLSEFGK